MIAFEWAQEADHSPRSQSSVLLQRWTRLSRRHVPVAFGCGCGGFSHVSGEEFGSDLLDFLRDRHPGQVRQESLTSLLREIASGDETAFAALLADVQRSVDSWERSSGGLRAS